MTNYNKIINNNNNNYKTVQNWNFRMSTDKSKLK